MRKIRIAQIGTSKMSHGNPVFKRLVDNPDVFEVVGVCFPEKEDEKWPENMPQFDGYKRLTLDEILKDDTIEAVTVETEEIYLTKYALMAAKHNKHIHMEKPGGIEHKDFEELVSIMKKTGKVFSTGYMYRFNPCVMELMEEIKRGELGDIISVEAQMCTPPYDNDVREWLDTFPDGMMYFLGCHLVDLVFQIMGKPIKVYPMSRSTNVDGVSAKDSGMCLMEYKSGMSVVKTCAYEYGGPQRRQLSVVGTNKTVEIRPLETGDNSKQTATKKTYDTRGWSDAPLISSAPRFDRYRDMLFAFAAMVRGEKTNPYTLDYELELHKLVLECCGKQ